MVNEKEISIEQPELDLGTYTISDSSYLTLEQDMPENIIVGDKKLEIPEDITSLEVGRLLKYLFLCWSAWGVSDEKHTEYRKKFDLERFFIDP